MSDFIERHTEYRGDAISELRRNKIADFTQSKN